MIFEVDLFVRNKELLDWIANNMFRDWERLFGNNKNNYYLELQFF